MRAGCGLVVLGLVLWVLSFAFHLVRVQFLERTLFGLGALAIVLAGLVFFALLSQWLFRR